MKNLAWILLSAGAGLLVFGLIMDVSVGTAAGRVANLSLMNERQIIITCGLALPIASLLLFILDSTNNRNAPAMAGSLRACPACAEPIMYAAVKCKHCGTEVEAMPEPVSAPASVSAGPAQWVLTIPFKTDADKQRIHGALQVLGLNALAETMTSISTGPFANKDAAGEMLRQLMMKHKLDGSIDLFRTKLPV